MIGFIHGCVVHSSGSVNTIDVGGVGYEIHVNESPGVGFAQRLWVHEHAPQDAPHELYGFERREDRDMFRRLLNVKGVGPKVAMRIVSNKGINCAGVPVPATLAAIRGVGPKIVTAIMEEFGA